jgi:hypothetical protein
MEYLIVFITLAIIIIGVMCLDKKLHNETVKCRKQQLRYRHSK